MYYAGGRMDFAQWKFNPKFASSNLQVVPRICRRFSVGLTGTASKSKIHVEITEFRFVF